MRTSNREKSRVEELEAVLHDMEVVNHRLREEFLANSLEQSREIGVIKSAPENLEAEYKNLEEELEAVVQAHELTQEQLAETVKEKLDLSERLSSSDSENTLLNDRITGIKQKNKSIVQQMTDTIAQLKQRIRKANFRSLEIQLYRQGSLPDGFKVEGPLV